MLYVTSHPQTSNNHKRAYFLVCIHLRNVWDTSMIWNGFVNPVTAAKRSSWKGSWCLICSFKSDTMICEMKAQLVSGKVHSKNPIDTTGQWLTWFSIPPKVHLAGPSHNIYKQVKSFQSRLNHFSHKIVLPPVPTNNELNDVLCHTVTRSKVLAKTRGSISETTWIRSASLLHPISTSMKYIYIERGVRHVILSPICCLRISHLESCVEYASQWLVEGKWGRAEKQRHASAGWE